MKSKKQKKQTIKINQKTLLVSVFTVIVLFILFNLLVKNKNSRNKITKLSINGLNGLVFQSKNDEKKMQTLDQCIQNFSKSGWKYYDDYREVGNFYEAAWCNGKGCKYPNKSDAFGKRDTHRITLSTTEYKLPQVYGVALDADFVPNQPGWGVNFSFANGMASTVTNDRLQINFFQYHDAEGEAQEKVYVGWGDSYKIYETEIVVNSPRALEEDLTRYTSSAQSMRDNTLVQLKNLRQKVSSTIASNTITRCVQTKQIRANLPPMCIKRSILNETEKTEELKKANDYLDSQESLLNQYYQQMYAVLVKAVPLKNCPY